jgi:hypothetical protein
MKPLLLCIGAGLLIVAAAAGAIWSDGNAHRQALKEHRARPLRFDPPAQPDIVGPVRVRVLGRLTPGRTGIMLRADYLGYATAQARDYGDETNVVDLGQVFAAGGLDEIIEIPDVSFDRRARAVLQEGEVKAIIYAIGVEGGCFQQVDEAVMKDVVVMDCR